MAQYKLVDDGPAPEPIKEPLEHPLFQDNPQFGRLALDPGRLKDVGDAVFSVAHGLFQSLDRLVHGGSEPRDVMSAIGMMAGGSVARISGGAELGAVGRGARFQGTATGKILAGDDAQMLIRKHWGEGKTDAEIADHLNDHFRLEEGTISSRSVTGARQRMAETAQRGDDFELGAMGGQGKVTGAGETFGPKRDFTTGDVVMLMQEAGMHGVKVKSSMGVRGASTDYVMGRVPATAEQIKVRLPNDPAEHIGMPMAEKGEKVGNFFDAGVHLPSTAKQPLDPRTIFNAAGGTFSQWKNLEDAIKWRASVSHDGNFLIAPDQAPLAARTVEHAKAPPHPVAGADFHPDQLKLLATGEHILMSDFIKEIQHNAPDGYGQAQYKPGDRESGQVEDKRPKAEYKDVPTDELLKKYNEIGALPKDKDTGKHTEENRLKLRDMLFEFERRGLVKLK
jgi:hypothetical protein